MAQVPKEETELDGYDAHDVVRSGVVVRCRTLSTFTRAIGESLGNLVRPSAEGEPAASKTRCIPLSFAGSSLNSQIPRSLLLWSDSDPLLAIFSLFEVSLFAGHRREVVFECFV
jgi:hypothetical protein